MKGACVRLPADGRQSCVRDLGEGQRRAHRARAGEARRGHAGRSFTAETSAGEADREDDCVKPTGSNARTGRDDVSIGQAGCKTSRPTDDECDGGADRRRAAESHAGNAHGGSTQAAGRMEG